MRKYLALFLIKPFVSQLFEHEPQSLIHTTNCNFHIVIYDSILFVFMLNNTDRWRQFVKQSPDLTY